MTNKSELKENFEFLNSEVWLKYTQERYLPLNDIKYRLDKAKVNTFEWNKLKYNIQLFRKMGAIPFLISSINKKFWFFLSDSINKKIHRVEVLGNKLFEKIENQGNFKEAFLTNATVEEAITSAIYEGANSTRYKAKSLIASGDKPKSKGDLMLINNYLAMKWIKDNSTLSLSNEIILRIHKIVSDNTLEGDDANFCGVFRNDVVYIGNHQGIKHSLIKDSLKEIIELIDNHPRFLHGLLKGIILHYFIAYIHPFFDGNGRTARALFYFKAITNNLKFVELLSVSADLKEHGKRYEKSFDLVEDHENDMTYFIDFCLDSLLIALGKVEKKIAYLIDISLLKKALGLSHNQVFLLQIMALNKHRAITIEEYAQRIKKSRELARKELKELLRLNLLKEKNKGKKLIYFVDRDNLRNNVYKNRSDN